MDEAEMVNRPPALPKAAAPARRQLRPYALGWAALAVGALAYLGTLALYPDLLAQPEDHPDLAQAQRTASKALAEALAARQSVAQVQLEMARLRADARASEDLGKGLLQRVATLEDRALPPAPEATPAVAVPAIKKAPEPAKAPDPRKPPGAEAKAPASGERIETGSVATPATAAAAAPDGQGGGTAPVAFGPAVVKPQAFGLQIASAPSVDALRLMWNLLSDNHPDPLKSMETRYAASADKAKPGYDLVVGPLKSQADARKACKDLQSRGVACRVATFSGEAL
jgi:hypothetical protein